MQNIKTQLFLIRTAIFNLFYNYSFFWLIRKLVLNLFGVKIGKNSYIHFGVRFFSAGKIIIGRNTTINPRCYLDNRKQITIGDNVNISHDTKIYTLGHDINDPMFKSKGAPVVIKDYACIFANVLIMPGVTIGKGAVVYPGSVVAKDVLDYEIVGGNPAKKIGKRKENLKYNLDYKYHFAI